MIEAFIVWQDDFGKLRICTDLARPLGFDREPDEPMGKPPAFGDEAKQILAGLELVGVKQLLQDDENGGTSGIALFRKVRDPLAVGYFKSDPFHFIVKFRAKIGR